MITYSMTFASADQADRAAARLRSRGITVRQYQSKMVHGEKEPALMVGYPYSYPATVAGSDYTTGLINGLPQTDGSAVIVPAPFFERVPAVPVTAQFTVMDFDAERTRRMLINCGGNELRIIH